LAIADKIESVVLEERGENRQSNALRYIQRFAKYPCSTWKILYVDKLQPYLKYLKQMHPKLYNWYEDIIQNISEKVVANGFATDDLLSGKFLLGYHCQQKDFWRKRDKNQLEENKQEEN
jgi:CRISPR-associated protein Csd1